MHAPVFSPPDPDRIAAARLRLAEADPVMARLHAVLPVIPWRTREGGYLGLMRIIVQQQVSTASAAAIWTRLETGLGEVAAETVLRHDEAALRALGLSLPKARYALAIARAQVDGVVDLARLPADDGAAIAALVSLKGVGRWTAEVYLMFCEGRMDMFPAGDLVLQEMVRVLEDAPARPSEKALYLRSEAWRPYRGVAAHLLWAYYAARRGDVGAPVLSGEAN